MPASEVGFAYRGDGAPRRRDRRGRLAHAAPGDPAAIRAAMDAARRWRRDTHPIAEPNCGSVFTNPPGDHAAAPDRRGRPERGLGGRGVRLDQARQLHRGGARRDGRRRPGSDRARARRPSTGPAGSSHVARRPALPRRGKELAPMTARYISAAGAPHRVPQRRTQGSWANGGSSSGRNQRISSCSSGATFAGVPFHAPTSQALRRTDSPPRPTPGGTGESSSLSLSGRRVPRASPS